MLRVRLVDIHRDGVVRSWVEVGRGEEGQKEGALQDDDLSLVELFSNIKSHNFDPNRA